MSAGPFQFSYPSLGLFRVALGGLLLYDLLSRGWDFEAHYSENGVLPLSYIELSVDNYWGWSPYFLSTAPNFLWLIFAYQVFLSVCFMFGYKTRFSQFMSWVLLCSLQARNPFINYGADSILASLLFITLLFPLDRAFTLKKGEASSESVSMAATWLYTLQIACIYFFAALEKSGESWWSGNAVKEALQLSQYSNDFGHYLLNYPGLLNGLTYLSLALEFFAPLLLLIPKFRMIGVCLIACLQIGFLFTMDLGIFPYLNLVALLPWFPFKATNIQQPHVFKKSLALFLSVVILSSNLITLFKLDRSYDIIASSFKLEQAWVMFAPNPPVGDLWFILAAQNSQHISIDLLGKGKPVTMNKPNDFKTRMINDRWSEYFYQLAEDGNDEEFQKCIEYYLTQWNAKHNTNIQQAELMIMQEDLVTKQGDIEIKKVVFYQKN